MTSEERLKTIEPYRNTYGAIFDDDVASQALLEELPWLKSAADFLGYSDARSMERIAKKKGLIFRKSRYSREIKHEQMHGNPLLGPIEQWPIEEIEKYFIRMSRIANRAKCVYITTDEDEVRLDGYSDLHVGPGGVDYDELSAAFQKTEEDGAYCFFGGDTLNTTTTQSVGAGEMQFELPLNRCLDLTVHWMKPLLPRIGFIDEGNHEERVKKSLGIAYSPALQLAKLLGNEDLYMPYCGFCRWHITHRPTNTKQVYVQYHHHGHGGGRSVGMPLNKLLELAAANEADFYTMGHLHRDSAGGADKRYTDDEGVIRIKGRLLVALRSFQLLEDDNYAGRAGYRPNVPGVVPIWLGAKERSMRTEISR